MVEYCCKSQYHVEQELLVVKLGQVLRPDLLGLLLPPLYLVYYPGFAQIQHHFCVFSEPFLLLHVVESRGYEPLARYKVLGMEQYHRKEGERAIKLVSGKLFRMFQK